MSWPSYQDALGQKITHVVEPTEAGFKLPHNIFLMELDCNQFLIALDLSGMQLPHLL